MKGLLYKVSDEGRPALWIFARVAGSITRYDAEEHVADMTGINVGRLWDVEKCGTFDCPAIPEDCIASYAVQGNRTKVIR
jgi:hypothetical protein